MFPSLCSTVTDLMLRSVVFVVVDVFIYYTVYSLLGKQCKPITSSLFVSKLMFSFFMACWYCQTPAGCGCVSSWHSHTPEAKCGVKTPLYSCRHVKILTLASKSDGRMSLTFSLVFSVGRRGALGHLDSLFSWWRYRQFELWLWNGMFHRPS